MNRILALLAIGLSLNVAAAAEGDSRFAKPVDLPELAGEELVAVRLDSDIYQATDAGFPDLRLIDGDGKEVAYIVRKVPVKKARTVKRQWPAEHLALKPRDDGGLEITFDSDLKKHSQPPQGIHLRTNLRNFEHHVRVDASADGEHWQTVLEDGLIFDYSQYMDVRNLSLEFDPSSLPKSSGDRAYYRLTIDDVTQEQQSQLLELTRNMIGDEETSRSERVAVNRQPLRLNRIDLWHDEVRQDIVSNLQRKYPMEIAKTVEDAEAKQTHVYLASRREPITQITVVTPERNFSRPARVEALPHESTEPLWQTLGAGSLTRFDIQTLRRESLAIELPETRHLEYRLVIENGDSQPVAINAVEAEGLVYEVVFVGAPATEYRLAYGGALTAPHYDTAALTAALQEGLAPSPATLGSATALPLAAEPSETWLVRLINNGPAVVTIIAVLAILLAAGLYRAVRRMDELGQPGQE